MANCPAAGHVLSQKRPNVRQSEMFTESQRKDFACASQNIAWLSTLKKLHASDHTAGHGLPYSFDFLHESYKFWVCDQLIMIGVCIDMEL